MKILITLEVEDGDENLDPDDATGLTVEAYEQVMPDGLGWLGEITEVKRA